MYIKVYHLSLYSKHGTEFVYNLQDNLVDGSIQLYILGGVDNMGENISISLSSDEALILSDYLSRISENENFFEDKAEQQVLWAIEAQLDKILVEPFMPNYLQLVLDAKNRIRFKDE